MDYVFKINCGDTLRRVTVPARGDSAGPKLTFNELETKIREIFKISPTLELKITYIDKENDVVTMGGDQDLEDACVAQLLNPVRLDVNIVDDKRTEEGKPGQTSSRTQSQQADFSRSPDLKLALESLVQALPSLTTDVLKQLFTVYEPLLKAAVSTGAMPQTVEGFLKTVIGQTCPGTSLHTPFTEPSNSPSTETPEVPTSGKPKQAMEAQHADTPSLHTSNAAVEKGTYEREIFNRSFHKNVQCDACGMHPIVGPRFKSIKNDNFDLCISCFTEIGNEADYQRFDRPVHPRRTYHQHPMCGPRMMRNHHMGPPFPFRPFFPRGPAGWKPEFQDRTNAPVVVNTVGEHPSGKLDARFVRDVTIFDGTELAPGTSFTKIWRLRNIGSLPWPQQTQLVHVGGDILHSDASVLIELPEDGLTPDNEIEVSVDLIAPEQPGRYVSHWRLMAPSGQKFGHRVWVLIQVVPKDEQSPQVEESMHPIKQGATEESISFEEEMMTDKVEMTKSSPLQSVAMQPSAPPADVTMEIPEVSFLSGLREGSVSTEHQVEVMNEVNSEVDGFAVVERPVEDMVDGFMQKGFDVGHATEVDQKTVTVKKGQNADIEQLFGLQLDETFLSSDEVKSPAESNNSIGVSLSVPVTDEHLLGELPKAETFSHDHDDLQSILQETLLEHLESQGFTQRALNIELLEKNKNNLQCTIQDLVSATEWDPVLNKLQEMGFHDKELSLRLVFKNNGSLKQVVKELVQMQAVGGWNGTAAVKGKEKAL
eukprot:c21959_g1_i1 orf=204-2495(+)